MNRTVPFIYWSGLQFLNLGDFEHEALFKMSKGNEMEPSVFTACWQLMEFLFSSTEKPIEYVENGKPVHKKI